jgi:hypothetical protein
MDGWVMEGGRWGVGDGPWGGNDIRRCVSFGRDGLILRGFSQSVLMIHGCVALTEKSINQSEI